LKKEKRITAAYPAPFTKRGKQPVNFRGIFLTFCFDLSQKG
jgi:hypothetical protein